MGADTHTHTYSALTNIKNKNKNIILAWCDFPIYLVDQVGMTWPVGDVLDWKSMGKLDTY